MAARYTPMDKWIAEVLVDPNIDGDCTSISVEHKEGPRDTEVYSVKIEKGGKVNPVELAEIFRRKAETHVQGLPGRQQFFLRARYNNRSEHQGQLPFPIDGGADLSYGMTEAPNDEGRRSQRMRHEEFGHQSWATMVHSMFHMMHDRMKADAEDRKSLVAENRDATALFKEMLYEHASRNHQFEMEKMRMQRENLFYEQAAKLGPSVVNALAGKEVIPQAAADGGLIDMLIQNLTPEAVTDIQKHFPPQIVGLIMARANEYMKKKVEAEKAAATAVEGRNDPILDS
jgi:hypothetical protein